MRQRTKIMAACLVAPVALFVLHVVGTLTFYKSIVPILAPVLPRPEGVPRNANASYSWKGLGLFWEWETKLSQGSVSWVAAKMFNHLEVELVNEDAESKIHNLGLRFTSGTDEIVIGQGGKRTGGETCPFKISKEQLAALGELVTAAKKTANNDLELPALIHVETRLAKVDGQNLTTDSSGGCNDLSLSDYGKD